MKNRITLISFIFLVFVFLAIYLFYNRNRKLEIIYRADIDFKCESNIYCGIINSHEDEIAFKKTVNCKYDIQNIDYNKFMWIYSKEKIKRVVYFKKNNLVILVPYNYDNENIINIICVKKCIGSLKYASPED